MTHKVPAVVIGADLNGLGVVRSLARSGIPTISLDTTHRPAAMRSRFCRTMTVDKLYGTVLIDRLMGLRKKLGQQPALMSTNALTVRTISEYREELQEFCRFRLPPRDIVAMLQNKARFFEFVEQQGLPVPRTLVFKSGAPLTALSTMTFPAVIKPAEAMLDQDGEKVLPFHVATLRDAEAVCNRLLQATDELIVQEWIEGPDSNICFSLFHCALSPVSLKVFVGRKITAYPANVGRAVFCLPAPEVVRDLAPMIMKILDLADFEGLGSLEFKWDARRRRYVIIGTTVGHTDWHGEIATLSGVNLPLAAYDYAVGQSLFSQNGLDRNVAWRESALLDKQIPMLSPNTRVYDGYWRRNDSKPGLSFNTRAALQKYHRNLVKPIFTQGSIKHMFRNAHLAVERKIRISQG